MFNSDLAAANQLKARTETGFFAMSASARCHHPELDYTIVTEIGEDGRHSYAKVTAAHCPHCSRRWRFVGVSNDFDPGAPTANRTATEILLPMVEIVA